MGTMMTTTEDAGDQVRPSKSKTLDEAAIARANWDRYEYVDDRGHRNYCERAKRLEDLYMGGGSQWRAADRAKMETEGRYPIEINEVLDAVNTILGFQINNRVDVALTPKREASTLKAEKMSKVLMKVKDDLNFTQLESEMFADGLIQQRGYLDLRVRYDENLNGEPALELLDPLDVIPDPDAKGYDPDSWGDVTVTRWLTGDEIEATYGEEKRREVEESFGPDIGEEDFGNDLDDAEERNRFGDDLPEAEVADVGYFDAKEVRTRIPRFRVIDRQYWKMSPGTLIGVWPTGDIRILEDMKPENIAKLRTEGVITLRRPRRRIRWTVSTNTVLLHDDWSPYSHFTIIPFFPLFRRGKTRGMVDNLEGPQELLNSTVSTVNQIVRSTANSGYFVEQNSLSNMRTEDLEFEGARNGVVIEYKKGFKEPKKIEPNPVPQGVAELASFASEKIKGVSGMTDAMRGQGGKNQSGLAGQVQQFAAQLSSAPILDNLARSRRIFVRNLIEQLQQTLTEPQVMLITETDPFGNKQYKPLHINQLDPQDGDLFDPTSGEYDYAITDQPAHVTFQNSQFDQSMRMKDAGIAIPDWVPVKHSNLTDKAEILEDMRGPKTDPVADAQAKKLLADAELSRARAVAVSVEAQYSSVTSAQLLGSMPGLAPAADAILLSAGFEDKNEAPIFPADVPLAPPPQENTNPLTPTNPDAGMTTGIESGEQPQGAA